MGASQVWWSHSRGSTEMGESQSACSRGAARQVAPFTSLGWGSHRPSGSGRRGKEKAENTNSEGSVELGVWTG